MVLITRYIETYKSNNNIENMVLITRYIETL